MVCLGNEPEMFLRLHPSVALKQRSPLEKGLANHFSILPSRTPRAAFTACWSTVNKHGVNFLSRKVIPGNHKAPIPHIHCPYTTFCWMIKPRWPFSLCSIPSLTLLCLNILFLDIKLQQSSCSTGPEDICFFPIPCGFNLFCLIFWEKTYFKAQGEPLCRLHTLPMHMVQNRHCLTLRIYQTKI